MKKSVLMFSLLSGTALMFPRLTIASGLPTHTHPSRSPPFSLNNPTKPIKPPPSVSSAPLTAATQASDPWAETTAIKSIPCNNAETRDIQSLPVPSSLILPDNVPITALILPNVSKTAPAPAVRLVMSTAVTTVISRTILKAALMTALIKNASAIRATVMTILWKKPMPKDMKPAPSATAAAQ